MDIEMVFNELSLQTPAQNIHIARQWMSTLLQTTAEATKNFGVKRVLRVEKEFFEKPLAPEYTINIWRNDRQVDRDEKRRFYSLQTKYPSLIGLEETEIEKKYLLFDFQYRNSRVHGLAVAFLLEALALSFISDIQWDNHELQLQIPEPVSVHHAAQPEHVKENAEWIKHQLQKDNLWLKHRLPQDHYRFQPHKIYYHDKLADFPTKLHQGNKVFIDDKDQLWLWDPMENHWDVQVAPYGRDNYFRVTPDGRLLDGGREG